MRKKNQGNEDDDIYETWKRSHYTLELFTFQICSELKCPISFIKHVLIAHIIFVREKYTVTHTHN